MAWIGPAIGVAGGIFGDVLSSMGQQDTNAMNRQIMQDQMQWQEKMSNTAMQRRVADLRQAGLNPMLAVNSNGAQVSPVNSAQVQNPDAAFGNLGNQVSSAMSLATQNAQVQQMQANADKTRADTAVTMAQLPYSADTAKQNLENMKEQLYEINAHANALKSQFEVNTQNAQKLSTDNDFLRQLNSLKVQMEQLDVQRVRAGLPRLENDAAWQKAHPELSGWLQSGSVPAAGSVINSALRMRGFAH